MTFFTHYAGFALLNLTPFSSSSVCIKLGTLLDNPSVVTLEEPEQHSYHCLLDVPQCYESGYVVLTDKNEETGMHCLGYRLDDSEAIIAAGRAKGLMGFCSTCTGAQGNPEYGFRATIKGAVKELGDGTAGVSGTPLLEVTEVLDDGEMCETPTIGNPVCMELPSLAPTPDASAVIDTTVGAKDCTKEMCESQLADNLLLKYQINVPSDTTLEACAECTISMEAIYDGEAWVAIAFSTDGLMIGSQAVM